MKRRPLIGQMGLENPAMELELTDESERPEELPQTPPRPKGSQYTEGSRPAGCVSGAVRAAAQWYTCSRWKRKANQRAARRHSEMTLESKYKGLAEDEEGDEDVGDGNFERQRLNKKLLNHFRELATSNQGSDQVDLQYVGDIISEGADLNATDRYGQTALHEISRAWSVDVMRFFLDCGSDLQQADGFGVTALHVAAALDYSEMTHFLLQRNADIEARTELDRQTPLHYAAKNDAVDAIRTLLEAGADISSRDYKQRTPLQLAAIMDRSEAVCALLELGADAGVKDSDGQLCITAMICRMPPVAHLALNQFHVTERVTRKQFYYLNLLEAEPSKTHEKGLAEPMSPLEVIVRQGCLDLIMHPVVLKLIGIKWSLYGRSGAWLLLILNFLFIVAWTTVAISASVLKDNTKPYDLPQDWWRVLLWVVAVLLAIEEVLREVKEMSTSRRKLQLWKTWSHQRTTEDLQRSHPMWPEERTFLHEHIRQIHKTKWSYSKDMWNVFDWLVYSLLLVAFGLHVADIFLLSSRLHTISLDLFAIILIFIWLRLLKHVRAFRVMGPFIVMLGKVVGDVMRFLFLYAEIIVPYACAFWIIFGGLEAVSSMRTFPALLYSLYRITLVDEYQFDAMVTVDPVMAYLLCGTFLFLSSILCMNLLIALLSDTFQRVYDNALANAVMQQAAIILQVEEAIPCLRRFYDNHYIHRHCAPLAEFYDDDHPTNSVYHKEMSRITSLFKENLDNLLENYKGDRPPGQSESPTENPTQQAEQRSRTDEDSRRSSQCPRDQMEAESTQLKVLQRLQENQTQQNLELQALQANVKELQNLLKVLVRKGTGPGTSGTEEPSN